MSRIKSDTKTVKRAALNTTINEQTLNDFKKKAKELNLNMNFLLELFMEGVIEDRFVLTIGKNNKIDVDIKE